MPTCLFTAKLSAFDRWMHPIGRLNPGVSIESAQTQLDAIARRLDQSGVSAESGWRVTGRIRYTSTCVCGVYGAISTSSWVPPFSSC